MDIVSDHLIKDTTNKLLQIINNNGGLLDEYDIPKDAPLFNQVVKDSVKKFSVLVNHQKELVVPGSEAFTATAYDLAEDYRKHLESMFEHNPKLKKVAPEILAEYNKLIEKTDDPLKEQLTRITDSTVNGRFIPAVSPIIGKGNSWGEYRQPSLGTELKPDQKQLHTQLIMHHLIMEPIYKMGDEKNMPSLIAQIGATAAYEFSDNIKKLKHIGPKKNITAELYTKKLTEGLSKLEKSAEKQYKETKKPLFKKMFDVIHQTAKTVKSLIIRGDFTKEILKLRDTVNKLHTENSQEHGRNLGKIKDTITKHKNTSKSTNIPIANNKTKTSRHLN